MIKKFKVKLDCASCVNKINKMFDKKVNKVDINFLTNTLRIDYDENKINENKIRKYIKDLEIEN